jgi:hypothetical protein
VKRKISRDPAFGNPTLYKDKGGPRAKNHATHPSVENLVKGVSLRFLN